jgi:succinate dehydrogenase / fumarate reductase, cytochrome b subunit
MRTAPEQDVEPLHRGRSYWLLDLWRSQLGKKYAMAVSGIVIFVYVFLHMLGNLKIYEGSQYMDEYAAWLRIIATPAAPEYGALWGVRIVLLVAFTVHILAAFQLARLARKARPVDYAKVRYTAADYAGRTMRWGGVIIALFVVYHLLDLTTGTLNPNGVHGEVHANVVADFAPERWYITLVYTLAVVAVGFHVRHGVWSALQTFGRSSAATQKTLQGVALGVALVLVVGFLSVPFAVLTGLVA